MDIQESFFGTDSMIVLQYIKNCTKRFQIFVAKRISVIHDGSSPVQWRHISSDVNPAGDPFRGLGAKEMITRMRWKRGPEFLWREEEAWPSAPDEIPGIAEDDKEVKKEARSCAVEARECEDSVEKLIRKYSCWYSPKRTVVWILRCKKWLQDRRSGLKHWPLAEFDLDVTELEDAETAIIRYLQGRYFEQELCTLETKRAVKMKSPIYCLEPFWDNEGLLCLGRRLLEAPISDRAKHPVILPRNHHVRELIVRNIHQWKAGHSGRNTCCHSSGKDTGYPRPVHW